VSGAQPTGPVQRILDPLRAFLRQEAASGVVLVSVTIVALLWANSAAADGYVHLWQHELTLGIGPWSITEDLQHWVNDGLMAVFFFVVGLEIKRELVTGELRERRAAALPALAALGGVVLPALIFLSIAPAGPVVQGWGVPMATDIAFAVGILALAGPRASDGAKLLLVSLAIVDDILAIVVIALWYSDHFAVAGVVAAVLLVGLILLLRRWAGSPWVYVLPAVALWIAVFSSGVHATIAGVVLGLLTPARPVRGRPVLEQLEHALHPISVYVIVPLFALANAGVDLRGGALTAALTSRLTWAVVAGLVVGKTLGIAGATFLSRRLGLGQLPDGMPAVQVWPVAVLGGIGFTVALFIADLAFPDPVLIKDAKVGVLIGSSVAAILGLLLVFLIARRPAVLPGMIRPAIGPE
jgi:NhaA family Na+:H+ antiporter